MNEALVLLLIISLTINVIAIWRLSATTARAAAHAMQLSELDKSVRRQSSQLERLKEYTASIHYHHDTMERSLRHHLHAAGLVYTPRLWETYSAIVRDEWPFERKGWPYHLPALGSASREADPENTDHYAAWRSHPAVQTYHETPQPRIDERFIDDMDQSIHHRVEESRDKRAIK